MRFFQTLCFLMILSFHVNAQVYGNKNFKTITKSVESVKSIDIQFNANITLDYQLTEELVITADENILEFIGVSFENGKLTLDQIKWIEPSKLPIITIGTPFLESIYQGTHSTTIVNKVNGQTLALGGNVGKIIVSGKIAELNLKTTGTDIDLSMLEIGNAKISIDDDSKVILDKVGQLETEISDNARLVFLSEIENVPASKIDRDGEGLKPITDLLWIDFQIKNNSLKRNHFVVVGPKKDGSRFSYGFSIFPNLSKKERWSVGTQVFIQKRSGAQELLLTISAEDEGKVLKLFN